MRRATLPLIAALAVLVAAGCGDDSPASTRVSGETLTIYASLPTHGADAAAGAAAERGMRRALAKAHGGAAGREVRLVSMSSTRPEDETWDPGTVEANAERAADDPKTIAYLGELDKGASAVSLPVTNRERIVQISPADGLTSLTRMPPGRPRAGPERYYPDELRTFVRLVPSDLVTARRFVSALRANRARRLTIVEGSGIADHEFEDMVVALIGEREPRAVTRVTAPEDDPDSIADASEDVVSSQPDAVVYTGAVQPRLRTAIAARLPGVPLLAQPSRLAGRYAGACASPERLGYMAMKLALDAIDAAGPDRRRVVRAARELAPVNPCP